MKFALAAAGALALGGHAPANPPPVHGPARPSLAVAGRAANPIAAPLPPLPMLPRVSRVRVEAARSHVVLVEEVNLPRGDWQSGGLDFYIAFGAPGAPLAVDARLVSVPPGALESPLDDPGEGVEVEAAAHRGPGVQPLLGTPQMAGVIVRVREAALRRALSLGDMAALRIRSLIKPPARDAGGASGLVVRLGIVGGLPMALGHLQVVSMEPSPWITVVQSRLCGPDADPQLLSTSLSPRAVTNEAREPQTIAPDTAVRSATDDLCIRWWAAP